eukprot:1756553-Prymnesium_polylepis.1
MNLPGSAKPGSASGQPSRYACHFNSFLPCRSVVTGMSVRLRFEQKLSSSIGQFSSWRISASFSRIAAELMAHFASDVSCEAASRNHRPHSGMKRCSAVA